AIPPQADFPDVAGGQRPDRPHLRYALLLFVQHRSGGEHRPRKAAGPAVQGGGRGIERGRRPHYLFHRAISQNPTAGLGSAVSQHVAAAFPNGPSAISDWNCALLGTAPESLRWRISLTLERP